jgi:hypothetical protein
MVDGAVSLCLMNYVQEHYEPTCMNASVLIANTTDYIDRRTTSVSLTAFQQMQLSTQGKIFCWKLQEGLMLGKIETTFVIIAKQKTIT